MTKLDEFVEELQVGAKLLDGQPDMDAVVISRDKYYAFTKMLLLTRANVEQTGLNALNDLAEDYFKCRTLKG